MIKILHVGKPVSGIAVYIGLLCRNINSGLFINQVTCDASSTNFNPVNSKGEEIKLYHLPIKREINPLKDLNAFFRLRRIIKNVKPDIIHCHSAKAGVVGRLLGIFFNIPTLYTPHGYSYLSTQSKLKRNLYIAIEKSFRYFKPKVLACSNSEKDRAVNDLKYNKNKVLLWSNSIEPVLEIKQSEILSNLPKKFICTIGRPSYQKNTELLIQSIHEAKKQLNSIHLVVLGVGYHSPSLSSVNKLIAELDLQENITLVPWLKREEMLSILEASLFFVSSSRYEGLPYAVLESLVLGKPCLLTNVDGNKDLVKNSYNGFLVKENYKEISSMIIELYTKPELLKLMSSNSKKLFLEKFSIDKNIRELENIYKKILE